MNWAIILKVGKYIAAIMGGLAVAWIFYAGLIRPTTKPPTTTKQEADMIVNHNYGTPKVYFGCMNMRIYERKKDVDKNNSIISPGPSVSPVL